MRWLLGHNMLMTSVPGSGKTLLARALPGILPEMSIEESLDVTRIYSVADQLPTGTPLIKHRPLPRAASYHFARWPGRGRQRSQAGRNIAGTQGCFVFG